MPRSLPVRRPPEHLPCRLPNSKRGFSSEQGRILFLQQMKAPRTDGEQIFQEERAKRRWGAR